MAVATIRRPANVMISCFPIVSSPQDANFAVRGSTLVVAAAGCVVLRRGVWPLAFRKRFLRRARVQQHAEQAVVALVAAAFEHERGLVVRLFELLDRRPRPRPCR